jgi:hypothetical protein
MEETDNDKAASLLRYGVNYSRKKFYTTDLTSVTSIWSLVAN